MESLGLIEQAAAQKDISGEMLELAEIHGKVEQQDINDARERIKSEFYEIFDALPHEDKSTIAYVAKYGYKDLLSRLNDLRNSANGNAEIIIGGHNMRRAIQTWNNFKKLDN